MTVEGPLFLVIDQGGHGSRVTVADERGRAVASHAEPVQTQRDGERVEQRPSELLDSIHAGLRAVRDTLGDRTDDIEAAGLAVQRASAICWDRESGAALSPVLSWLDRRGAALLAGTGLDAAWVRGRTGLHLSPHYGAAKLAWCLRELPAVRRAAAAGTLGLGPLSSWLLGSLGGGVYAAEATTAQRTLLWDRHERNWSPALCDAFGLPLDLLPPVADCDAGFGALGIGSHRVPLACCAGDQGLVVSAFGPPDESTVYINAGTGAFVLQPLAADTEPPDRGLLRTLAWAGAGGMRWVEEGTVNGAASALDQLADADLPIEPGEEAFFLNGVGGLGSPWWIADYPSRFVGPAGDAPTRERLVVESIVHLIVANITRLHVTPERVLLTGGLSNRTDLCRGLADALALPVDVPPDREATTRGMLAELSPAIAAAVPALERIEPDPAAHAYWRKRQEKWEALLLGDEKGKGPRAKG